MSADEKQEYVDLAEEDKVNDVILGKCWLGHVILSVNHVILQI